jgi:hypothetical protein
MPEQRLSLRQRQLAQSGQWSEKRRQKAATLFRVMRSMREAAKQQFAV